MNLNNLKARDLATVQCHCCFKTFERVVRDIRRNIKFGRNFYCSKKCLYEAKTTTIELCCVECGNNFTGFKFRKFCTQTCSATHNNKITKRKPRNNCKNCGTMCLKRQQIFCNTKCQQRFYYLAFIDAWLKGDDNGVRSSGLTTCKYIKQYLREKFGDKCFECGWNKVHSITGKVPIQLDHIDGNAENNKPENLRLLCPNCHSLTPTFGSLNRGNGRKNRYSIQALVV